MSNLPAENEISAWSSFSNVIPPPIEESDIFSADYLVDVGDVRSKAIEAMINRDKEIRRTTLGDDWAAQQQRQFVKRADVRRMTLI